LLRTGGALVVVKLLLFIDDMVAAEKVDYYVVQKKPVWVSGVKVQAAL
jgi:hypothetical protein